MSSPESDIDRRLREARAEERRRRDMDADHDARNAALIAEAMAERSRTSG